MVGIRGLFANKYHLYLKLVKHGRSLMRLNRTFNSKSKTFHDIDSHTIFYPDIVTAPLATLDSDYH